jgi:uroporphyrinogen-III synthase
MLPLQGKCVLVTRSPHQSHEFSQSLRNLGAEVVEMPTLVITPPDSWAELDQAIANLQEYHWLILTSVNGVENFFLRLGHSGKNHSHLHHLQIAAVGEKTAHSLAQHGITAHLIPENFIADSLLASFQTAKLITPNTKILFPRVQSGGREILVEELTRMGATVHAVPAYESRCPERIAAIALECLQSRKVDFITFTSSKTVRHFCYLLDQVAERSQWQSWIANSQIIAIGEQTARTCHELLGRRPAQAPTATMAGMTTAIVHLAGVSPIS